MADTKINYVLTGNADDLVKALKQTDVELKKLKADTKDTSETIDKTLTKSAMSLSETLGPVGTGVAAIATIATAGIYALGKGAIEVSKGIKQLIETSEEYANELQKINMAQGNIFNTKSIQNVHSLSDSLDSLKLVAEDLVVNFVGSESISGALKSTIYYIDLFGETLIVLKPIVKEIARSFYDLYVIFDPTSGIAAKIEAFKDATRDDSGVYLDFYDSMGDIKDRVEEIQGLSSGTFVGPIDKRTAPEIKKITTEVIGQQEAWDAAAKSIQAYADKGEEVQGVMHTDTFAVPSDFATRGNQKSKDELDAELDMRKEKLNAWRDTTISVASDVASALESISENLMNKHLSLIQDLEGQRDAFIAAGDAEGVKRTNQKIAEERKAAKKQFAIHKAEALAQAAIDIAAGIIADLALGVPLALPAIIATSAAGALQLGVIAASQPTFHTGLSPTEYSATLDKGESVLTRKATADLGYSNVRALNEGRGMGNSGTQTINMIYSGRVLDTVLADVLSEPSSKTGAVIRQKWSNKK